MARMSAPVPVATALLVPFAGGMLAGGLSGPSGGGASVGWAAALALALLALLARERGLLRRVALAAAAAGIGAGALAAALAALPPGADDVARVVDASVASLEGTIVRSERARERVVMVVRAERVRGRRRRGPIAGLVGVTIAHTRREWAAGRRVRLVGRLRRPRNFGNPTDYDFVRSLARRGVRVTMFLWDDAGVETLGDGEHAGWADRTRARLDAHVVAASVEPVRGYLRAVLLGAAQSVDPTTRAALTRSGLAHVVSVSGFHVAVAAGSAVVVLRRLAVRWTWLAVRTDVTTLAALVGLVPVGAYAAIAGGTIPAGRALVMYGLVLGAWISGRPPDGIRALAAAAVLLASATPDVGADVSFELSFVSVAALVLIARGRPHRRRDDSPAAPPTWPRRLVLQPLVISVAATVATAPLTAWHFQQVSLVAPLANLVVLPLLGPGTLLPGLAALPLVPLSPALADALLALAGAAAAAGLRIAAWFAGVPHAAIATPMPTLLEVALCYGGLALWWWAPRPADGAVAGAVTRRRWRTAVVLAATVMVADVGYWAWQRFGTGTLSVTFLSVGQGDAAVVEAPGGAVLVVDGGGFAGDFDPGERLIAPYLRSRKILRVDALVLSHPQLDHYGGLAHLAEQFAPREFWSNGMRASAPGFVRLEAALARAGARRVVLARGTRRLLAGGVAVDVLHPKRADAGAVNDSSLVLRFAFGDTSILFTGDIERAAELDLLRVPETLASTVLKVPHHGSATSSTAGWLAAVRPTIAVVSSGADNRFGFPAPAVVQRLRAGGASVWNTAESGAVRVVSDGTSVTVTPTREAPGHQ